jgi:hypothetical protein
MSRCRIFIFIGIALSGCHGSGHVGQWPAPPPSEQGLISPPVRVTLDSYDGFTDDFDVEKARRAVITIQSVLNSQEFRCRVLSFDARWGFDTPQNAVNCVADRKRQSNDGNHVGFYWGDRGSPDAATDYGTPITNAEVYTRIVAAQEPEHRGEQPGLAHLATGMRSSFLRGSLGDTENGVTTTNSNWVQSATLQELAGHWTHEYMHVLSFTHARARSAERAGSVPYAVGLFACQIAKSYLPEVYESEQGDACIERMQGL